jgi:glycosyltransferase involved in cell wall biosynthesis
VILDKIKVLFVTDDIRMPTGVGIQAQKLMLGLLKTGKYTVSSIAGSLRKQNPQPVLFKDIKLYPTSDAYGNPNLLRTVMNIEKPDILVLFSDPRFFDYIFMMDSEIRTKTKIVLYHTWDNSPFPKFNMPYYLACDSIVTISKFSHDLLQQNGVDNINIAHGQDPSEFFILDPQVKKNIRTEFLQHIGRPATDFIIFWNNRNISRKRPGDVVMSFLEFYKTHPNSLLLMNTVTVDPEGTDIGTLVKDLNKSNAPIVLNQQRVNTEQLNAFYNISDVTLNIAHSEGFGLCVSESLSAGTPCCVVKTGGMTEQMQNDNTTFGILMEPEVKELFGVVQAPYIHRDYVSVETIVKSLEEVYQRTKQGAWKTTVGLKGKEFINQNFHINTTIAKWDEYLQNLFDSPKMFKQWRFSIH